MDKSQTTNPPIGQAGANSNNPIINDPNVQAAIQDLAQLTAKPTESLQDVVENFEEKQADFQAMYNAGGTFKQKLEQIAGSFHKGGAEHEPIAARVEKPIEAMEEVLSEPELEKKPELSGYIEKVEKAAEITKQFVVDDYTQQVLLKPAANQNPKVILPLTQEEEEAGLKMKVWDSLRWLAEWCARQFKMLKGRVEFKQPEEKPVTQ